MLLSWWFMALASCAVVGAGLLLAPASPLRHELARQQWLRRAPPHYEIEARWSSGGWSVRARLEVRDGRLVDGVDLRSGQRLDAIELGMLGHMFPVERTFDEIDTLRRWPATWRGRLASLLPWPLARRVERCSTPPPRVRYDVQFGHPVAIDSFANPCFNGIGYRVRIDNLRPLP
jgi:hypothetical protein